MTPEGKVKAKVKTILKEHGIYCHCPVQNGMGSPTLDFICCFRSYYLAIETKDIGQDFTPRQRKTAGDIEAAKGAVLRIDPVNVDKLGQYLDVMIKGLE